MYSGTIYNHWRVITKESYDKVLCECLGCGLQRYVRSNYLKQGQSKSCGCMNDFYKRQTSLENFGTEHPNQSEGQKAKISNTKKAFSVEKKQIITKKRFETNLEKYGSICPGVEQSASKNRKSISKGTRFGYLEVVQDRNGGANLQVRCLACNGPSFEKEYHLLRWGGKDQSCGCLTKKVRIKKCLEAKQVEQYKAGAVFGYWELVEDYQPSRTQQVIVRCRGCDQKTITSLALWDLLTNRTKSCGCKKQEMTVATNLERFGVERPLQSPKIRAKVAQTLSANGTTKTSMQQLKIYEMLKEAGYKVELNKSAGVCNIDVFIELPQCNIALEYDGGGHFIYADLKDIRKKDIARDQVMIHRYGYKVLRIESMKDVMPTLQDIIDKIDYLCRADRNFVQLKMS